MDMIALHRLVFVSLTLAAVLLGGCEQPEKPHRPQRQDGIPTNRAADDGTAHLAGEARFLANVRQVTFDGKTGEGYFAPDGSAIIFQSIRGDSPFYRIYTKNCEKPFEPRAKAREHMVSTGEGRTTCAYYSPATDKIIYASSHLDPNLEETLQEELDYLEQLKANPRQRRSYKWDFDPHMDIFEANRDGSGLRRLTEAAGYDAEGAYSPDGSVIIFCSFRTGNGDIYIMNADGSNQRRLTNGKGYEGGAFISPDQTRIIYRAEAEHPTTGELTRELLQLFVMNIDGTGRRQLTHNGFVNFGPYWHPDSRHIIFATSAHGHRNYELYLMNVDTGVYQRVTYTDGADVLPVFSPDGKKLMWTSKRGKNKAGENESQLFIADWVYEGE